MYYEISVITYQYFGLAISRLCLQKKSIEKTVESDVFLPVVIMSSDH